MKRETVPDMCTTETMGGVRSKALLDRPYPSLLSGALVIRETVYGIVKRLDFFVQHIEAYRRKEDLAPREIRVLDVGCGTGVNVTIPLANAGYSVLGLDLDSASIDRARHLARGLRNIEFICGPVESLQDQEPFHVVICSEVLEHLRGPDLLVKQIVAFLKDGGLLLATVPNGFGYFELDSFFWRVVSRYPRFVYNVLYHWEDRLWEAFGSDEIVRRRKGEHKPDRLEFTHTTLAPDSGHYQSFTRSGITRLLTGQGLRIIALRNNTFLAGNLIGLLARELDAFLAWNGRVADRLPSFLVSGWLVAARKPAGLDNG